MIDFDKIPRPIYDELVRVFGEEKAHDIIIKNDYNMYLLSRVLAKESFIRGFRLRELMSFSVGFFRKIGGKVGRLLVRFGQKVASNKVLFRILVVVSVIASVIYLMRII